MKNNWDFPKAFLFDLDGVLIDSEPLHGQAWKETASLFDLNLTLSQLKRLRGRRRIDCAEELLKLIPKSVEIQDFLKLHKPISRRLILSAQAMPGCESLLRRCYESHIPMALVTSSSSESIKIKTSHHQWMNMFSIKILGDNDLLEKGKPAPDPYLLAAQKLNISPEECWAVEDSLSGVTSALNAGCYVLYLKEKNNALKKEKFGNKNANLKEICHLKDIEQLLDKYKLNKAC